MELGFCPGTRIHPGHGYTLDLDILGSPDLRKFGCTQDLCHTRDLASTRWVGGRGRRQAVAEQEKFGRMDKIREVAVEIRKNYDHQARAGALTYGLRRPARPGASRTSSI